MFDCFKANSFDKMVYVVCEQDVHFRQVFKAMEIFGVLKLQHLSFLKANGVTSQWNAHLLGDMIDHSHGREHKRKSNYQFKDYDAASKVMVLNYLVVHELSLRKEPERQHYLQLYSVFRRRDRNKLADVLFKVMLCNFIQQSAPEL